MSQTAPLHFVDPAPLVALIGNPNCGKTALFNLLTGSHQKVANYAGVTVEKKEGRISLTQQKSIRLLDLPGLYSLYPRSLDERVSLDVLQGLRAGEKKPDLVVVVVDATNLRRTLRLALAVKRLQVPCVLALNMCDVASKRGIDIDTERLSHLIDMPVIETIGIASSGIDSLKRHLIQYFDQSRPTPSAPSAPTQHEINPLDASALSQQDTLAINHILYELKLDHLLADALSDNLDRWLLHAVWGPVILALVLFVVFQCVFTLAQAPMDWIKSSTQWCGDTLSPLIAQPILKSLLVDGVIAGAGGVLVFLPQILILFFFILILEESGYLPRAAFLLDRLMGGVGLSGRSFIPLLSSFACAIPGIMAARTISNPRDRWVTIMIAPLMTCSARLPVYTLLISSFIPDQFLLGEFSLQGLVLFLLYLLGILGALLVALVLKLFTQEGKLVRPLMMELPNYHWPTLRNVSIGLWHRAKIFLHRVGGVILVLTLVLWFLASFPSPPVGAQGSAIEYSFAGHLGHALAHIFEPIGFNWQISVALIPGMAAREVVVSSLSTVYALSATENGQAQALGHIISQGWSLPTALSLLAWFIFAPQCLSTIAAVRRETQSLKAPLIMLLYLFTLAYLASWITFHVALSIGLG
jgi:ferrous iron transport protein B